MPSTFNTENKTTHTNKVTQQFIDRYSSFYSNTWKVIIVEGAKKCQTLGYFKFACIASVKNCVTFIRPSPRQRFI